MVMNRRINMVIEEKAYAKLNLSLDVTSRRDDGFHDMEMIMQSVTLADSMVFTFTEDNIVRAETNFYYIPNDERNLAVKAVNKYLEKTGKTGQGVKIKIHKSIPAGAGLGGGSADAAASLRAMNRAYNGLLKEDELMELAAEVGSDVAFCMQGGTQLAKGRGEILTPIADVPKCIFVICKPSFAISTPELFKKLDSCKVKSHPDTPGIIKAIENGNLGDMCRRMYNVFEDIDDRRMRTVSEIKGKLLDFGAHGAIMTGTGSAVFGVFTDRDAAEKASKVLHKEYGFCRVAEPCGRIDKI